MIYPFCMSLPSPGRQVTRGRNVRPAHKFEHGEPPAHTAALGLEEARALRKITAWSCVVNSFGADTTASRAASKLTALVGLRPPTYLISTLAPASSNFFLMAAAS